MIKIYIAPMAGVTDYTYRRIMNKFHPDLMFTEMISVNAVKMANKKTIDQMLRLLPNDGVQIFGRDIDVMVETALYIESLGVTYIDVNMGCPMPKITKNGYGSALLEDPEHVREMMGAIKKALKPETKLSMKIRIGYKEYKNPIELAKIAEELGLHHITVHGRTKEQMYSGTANWEVIKQIKDAVSIPVIGNGDIFTAEGGYEKAMESGVDGIMLARGIYGNPWLIQQIREKFETGEVITKVTYIDKINMALLHIEYMKEDYPEKQFNFEIRKHLCWYLKGITGGSKVKNLLNKIDNYDDIAKVLIELRDKLGMVDLPYREEKTKKI
ncbi:MAG: tRNA dihydrouridine synthase DusB [Psychrilyobacter sp.]|nr:tRNA dihydrouridine synthase DusB [Psychrilyobacter sp.]